MPKLLDHTGVTYGQLTGVRRLHSHKHGGAVWEWRCSCGNVKVVPAKEVRRGDTRSCGCASGLENHAGATYGRLTGVKRAPNRGGNTMWEWRCSCGQSVITQARLVKEGKTRSCGCLRREVSAERRYRDLTGQTFGLLTAIRPVKKRRGTHTAWEYRCACGNTHVADGALVTIGDIQSCGCMASGSDSIAAWLNGNFRNPNAPACFYVYTLANYPGFAKPGIAVDLLARAKNSETEYGSLFDFIEMPRFEAWLVEQAVLRETRKLAIRPVGLHEKNWAGKTEIRKASPEHLFALAVTLHGDLQQLGPVAFMLQYSPLYATQRKALKTLQMLEGCSSAQAA
jgi:predicted SprT family Zn-dependent metalloprotease